MFTAAYAPAPCTATNLYAQSTEKQLIIRKGLSLRTPQPTAAQVAFLLSITCTAKPNYYCPPTESQLIPSTPSLINPPFLLTENQITSPAVAHGAHGNTPKRAARP